LSQIGQIAYVSEDYKASKNGCQTVTQRDYKCVCIDKVNKVTILFSNIDIKVVNQIPQRVLIEFIITSQCY